MRHDVWLPKLNCGVCRKRLEDSKGQEQPQCYARECEVAHLMNPAFDAWLLVFHLLNGDLVAKNGLGKKLLEQAEWNDLDSVLLLQRMQWAFNAADREKRDAERDRGAGTFGGTGGRGMKTG